MYSIIQNNYIMKAGHPPHDHSNMKRLVYCRYEHIRGLALRQRETLDFTICIGSTVHQPFHISICISTLPTQHGQHNIQDKYMY